VTIYTFSVITSTGYPYYDLHIKNLPKGIKLYLRFFDFTEKSLKPNISLESGKSFELNAGLISALFEFARNMDKKIKNLEFKSRTDDPLENLTSKHRTYRGDVLITTQTETYLLHKSIRQKVRLIYDAVISAKIPLDSSGDITNAEEKKIIEILTDKQARNRVQDNSGNIRMSSNTFLEEMKDYGLEGICITSFDLSPIMVLGEKYSFKDIEIILRNIGAIPIIDPLEWKYRQSFFKGSQVWVYLINSGIGVTVDGLFEPYFYLLFADPQSYLGEFPANLASEFNMILG